MKKLFPILLIIYALLVTGCPVSKQTIKDNVPEAVKQVYFAKERIALANEIVLDLYKAKVISLETKNKIVEASLVAFDGIEFANEQIKLILLDMDNGVITPKSALDQIKWLVKNEVLIKINRYLVEFNLISQSTSDKWLPIIKTIRDVMLEVIDVLKLKNVTVPEVVGAKQ